MGSLFDGIGGFPLAASINGITPIWASEIVPDCISIMKRHFPDMKHLGDIEKINGAEIEPADIITFGSPCQDLSVAGKRAGLKGKRSRLFLEAIRIIKEMREKTNGACPRYAVWENVHGAFSSKKGEDFRIVIQEIASVAEGAVSIPRPPQRDGDTIWSNAGAVMGDGWSMAWRVLDAQYWGVPQRRRRIFLVADFTGQRAGEILFKPESVQGHIAQSGEAGEGTAGNDESGVRTAGFNGWRSVTGTLEYKEERAPCIQANMPPNVIICDGHNQNLTGGIANTLKGGRVDKDNIGLVIQEKVWPEKTRALVARADGSPCIDRGQLFIYDARGNGDGKTANTLDHENRVTDYTAIALDCRNYKANKISAPLQAKPNGGQSLNYINPVAVHQNQNGEVRAGKVANTLNTNGNASSRNAPLVYCIQGNTIERSDNAGANGKGVSENVAYTLNTTDRHVVAIGIDSEMNSLVDKAGTMRAHSTGGMVDTFAIQGFGDYKPTDCASALKNGDHKDSTDLITENYFVRRLTPLECERLQGLSDGWTEYGHDGRKTSDSARYRALGNSLAIPCADSVISRIKMVFDNGGGQWREYARLSQSF
jgi:DNA (cytosine-5)-methyltransferase 1